MAPEFKVRPARLDEAPRLSAFQIAMARESEGMELDRATVQRGVETFLQHSEYGIYYIITQDEEAVGCGMVQYEWSDWRARRVLWLHSVFVLPAYRQKGCFRAFYTFLQERVACDPELAGIRLYVDKSNGPAESVYRSLGMSDEHYKLFEWLK